MSRMPKNWGTNNGVLLQVSAKINLSSCITRHCKNQEWSRK